MSTPLRVLMVEDSEDDTVLVMRELRRGGFAPVFERVETPEAMGAALTGQLWDIVIADYAMPRFSGLAALALLQQSGLDLPFIVVSGNIGEDVAVATMKAGAHDYVMKEKLARLGPAVRRELAEAEVRRAHKRAEESLRESEERYRSLVETSPDAIIMAALDGPLLMVNQQAARLVGASSVEGMIGKDFFSFVAPAERERARRQARDLAFIRSARNLEYTLLRKDGSTFAAELSISVIEVAGQQRKAVIGVVRDVSERRQAEEALRRRNRELTTLYEAATAISSNLSPGAVLRTVAQQMTDALGVSECVLSLWNRDGGWVEPLVDYFPHRVGNAESPGVIDYLDDFPAVRWVLETRQPLAVREDVTAGGQSVLMLPLITRNQVLGLVKLVDKDQARRYAPAEIRLAQSLAAHAAVAIENARLYQETHRQAHRLAALLEIGQDILATLNLPSVLKRIATHARDLLEADDSDVYLLQPDGQSLRAIVSLGDYAEQTQAVLVRLGEGIVGSVATSGVAEIINNVEQDPRGVQIPGTPQESHALACAPLVSRGNVLGVMALGRESRRKAFSHGDLDFLESLARQASIAIENARLYAVEQQRAEELVHTLEQQRELDRLKDEFIQNVSHELRTPVTIIQGYADLLVNGELGELRPEQQQPVATIARRSAGLRDLVDNLTAILQAQTQTFRRTPVNLAQVVRSMQKDFWLVAEGAGLKLEVEIEPGLPPLLGDPDHLRRMLDNLVGNAIKFTPAGGTVTVRLRQADDRLLLEVSDTGVGILTDQLERVFERFYQVDGSATRRYGGTGLGLALVKEIAQAHGGAVAAESKVQSGSTFRVVLPCRL